MRFGFQVLSSSPKYYLDSIDRLGSRTHSTNKRYSKFPISIHLLKVAHEKMCSFFKACVYYAVHCFEQQWKHVDFISDKLRRTWSQICLNRFLIFISLSFCNISTRKRRWSYGWYILCCRITFRHFERFSMFTFPRSEFYAREWSQVLFCCVLNSFLTSDKMIIIIRRRNWNRRRSTSIQCSKWCAMWKVGQLLLRTHLGKSRIQRTNGQQSEKELFRIFQCWEY